jgi:hypothetical protein
MSEKQELEGLAKIYKRCMDTNCTHYIFEKCFNPFQDEALMREGIDVCAVTEVIGDDLQNKIVFYKGDLASIVPVSSSKISELKQQFRKIPKGIRAFEKTMGKRELEEFREWVEVRTERGEPQFMIAMRKSPETEFSDLLTGVENILKKGVDDTIEQAITLEVEEQQYITDISEEFRNNLTKALSTVAPAQAREMLFYILDRVSKGDPMKFAHASRSFKDMICKTFTKQDYLLLDLIDGGLNELDRGVLRCSKKNPEFPEELIFEKETEQ